MTIHRGKVYAVSQAGVFCDGESLCRPDWRVLAVAAEGSRLWLGGGVSGESGIIGHFDLERQAMGERREVGTDLVYDLAVSPNRSEVSWADAAGRVRTLATETVDLTEPDIHERMKHEGIARVVAYGPHGGPLASGGRDGAVILHQAAPADREASRRLQEHTAGVESLAFSPDGQWIASGSIDAKVRWHRVADGRLIRTYQGLGMEDEPVVGRLMARVLSLAWGEIEGVSRLIAGTSTGGLYELSQESSRWERIAQLDVGSIHSLAIQAGGNLLIGSQAREVLSRPLLEAR